MYVVTITAAEGDSEYTIIGLAAEPPDLFTREKNGNSYQGCRVDMQVTQASIRGLHPPLQAAAMVGYTEDTWREKLQAAEAAEAEREQLERNYTQLVEAAVAGEVADLLIAQKEAAETERDAWRARAEDAEAVLAEWGLPCDCPAAAPGSRDNPISVPTDGVLHITLPKELPRLQPHIYVRDEDEHSQPDAEHAGEQDS